MKYAFTLLLAGSLPILAGCQSEPTTAAAPAAETATTAVPTTSGAPESASAAADTGTDVSADSVAAMRPFVPAGYQLLATKSGDLNRDAYPDRLLVLDTLLPDSLRRYSESRRPLLVLTGQPNGGYRLAARNDNAVMCSSCGGMMGDPFQQLVIKNGYFSAEHYGGSNWRWTHIVTFKYDPTARGWFLHRAGGDNFHTSDPEKVKTHVETTRNFGRVSFERFTDDVGWDEGE